MTRNSIKSLFTLAAVVLTASLNAQVSAPYDEMLTDLLDHSVVELQVSQIDTADSAIVWLDARELEEYAVSSIPHSIHVGYDDFDASTLAEISKDAEIVVFCSVGYRSEKIAEEIQKLGYKNVSNLYGGIFQWVNEGHHLETPEGVATKQVHAFDEEWGKWLTKGNKVYH